MNRRGFFAGLAAALGLLAVPTWVRGMVPVREVTIWKGRSVGYTPALIDSMCGRTATGRWYDRNDPGARAVAEFRDHLEALGIDHAIDVDTNTLLMAPYRRVNNVTCEIGFSAAESAEAEEVVAEIWRNQSYYTGMPAHYTQTRRSES